MGNGTCSSLIQFLPDDLQPASPYIFTVHPDGDGDDQPEAGCIVFYRFAVPPPGTDPSHSPVSAVYYQSGCQGPGCIQYGQLLATGRDYLCENGCTPAEEDVLSQARGDELVIRDIVADTTVRLTVFQWVTATQSCAASTLSVSGAYVQAGHFIADRVTVRADRAELDFRLPADHPVARSQLARRRVLVPRCGPAEGWSWNLVEEGHAFFYDEPADVTRSLYPEAVVLSLYVHYTDTQRVQAYFTPAAWALLNGCASGQCGCALSRDQIADVQATLTDWSEWTLSEPSCLTQCANPNRARVEANVVCTGVGRVESPVHVTWTLVRQDERWLLDMASVSSLPAGSTEIPFIAPRLYASVPSVPSPSQSTALVMGSSDCPMDANGNLPAGLSREQIDYCLSLYPNH